MATDLERQPEAEKEAEPTPRQPEPQQSNLLSLHPAFYIGFWIFFSNSTILFNKWLIDGAGFRYPVILTCWHLVFATVATQLLARYTSLVDGRKTVKMTGRLYLRAVVPIGLLYSASLVCSNLVYLYLSVPFIQMLKAGAPVAVLLVAWGFGVEDPSLRKLLNVLFIVAGVGLASFGEIDFSWAGFLYQVAGIVTEAMRLVMIQKLLSGEGQRMDPIVSLYYYAPVCAAMNGLVALIAEVPSFRAEDLFRTGWTVLILNALVAFMLNVASVFLIGKTSSLVMTLTGILKNILLIIASVLIWGSSITALQFVGYGLALLGLVYYSLGWDQMVALGSSSVAFARRLCDPRGAYSLVSGSGSSSGSPSGNGANGEDKIFGVGVSYLILVLRRVVLPGFALAMLLFLAMSFLGGGLGAYTGGQQAAGSVQMAERAARGAW